MTTTVPITYIAVDERGVVRIAGSRSRVIDIVLDTRCGLTPQQIAEEYPHLSLAQIHAALSYYYDHKDAVDAEIERQRAEVERMRAEAVPFR